MSRDLAPREARVPRDRHNRLRLVALCNLQRFSPEPEPSVAAKRPSVARILTNIGTACIARRDGVDSAGSGAPGPLWVSCATGPAVGRPFPPPSPWPFPPSLPPCPPHHLSLAPPGLPQIARPTRTGRTGHTTPPLAPRAHEPTAARVPHAGPSCAQM